MKSKTKTVDIGEPVGTLLLDLTEGTLHLKINNRLVASVQPGSTLLIENLPANGKVRLNVVEGLVQFSAASLARKKRVTTDLTNQ